MRELLVGHLVGERVDDFLGGVLVLKILLFDARRLEEVLPLGAQFLDPDLKALLRPRLIWGQQLSMWSAGVGDAIIPIGERRPCHPPLHSV